MEGNIIKKITEREKDIEMYILKHTTKLVLTAAAFVACVHYLHAQSAASIENIDFYAEGSRLVITYDIVNAEAGETFEIWSKVITESGRQIVPTTTFGDIGKGVSGGPNKRIEWDIETDNAGIEEEFSVEIFARSSLTKASSRPPEKIVTHKKGISAGGAMILSAILPGLGRTVAKGGGGQWVLGLVGYSCVAGSILMNQNAQDAYTDYLASTTIDDRDENFTEAEDNKLYSDVFIGAAAAIWVFDLIYTGAVAGKERKKKNKYAFSVEYKFDPYSGSPMMGCRIRF